MDNKFEYRQYQEYILNRLRENQGINTLVELDCGLGKRFITFQLVHEYFPNLRFLLIMQSSSSLDETVQYLSHDYGGISGLGWITSNMPFSLRKKILEEKRVIICTPMILSNILQGKGRGIIHAKDFDAVIVNEIDTIIRRVSDRVVLTHPWNFLLPFFSSIWIIGMSGTLRDDHVVINEDQLKIRKELHTLKNYLKGTTLITMEDLEETDVKDFMKLTKIEIIPVSDPVTQNICAMLDEIIKNTRIKIKNELKEEDYQLDSDEIREIHLILDRLPISTELKNQYVSLLMLRKYIFAMTPRRYIRFFYQDFVQNYFNVNAIRKKISWISPKTVKTIELAMQNNKTVILCSYLDMVNQIAKGLESKGQSVFVLTGKTRDKKTILNDFKNCSKQSSLIMSPVGERDLDIPDVDLLVVIDVINTTKTMYQKFKRTRGGTVAILTYASTSEEKKVQRLTKNIMERYPWSTI